MHYFIGNLGHFLVILSFVSSLAAFFAYFKATGQENLAEKKLWIVNGNVSFYVHVVAVLGICATLFVILSNHYFEYHYAYKYSDKKLPTHYLISTFWNGQEGSFLLWMFWQAILGIVLIHTNKFWQAPVMTIFALVQAFLASMILGVVLPVINFKIGSSPFILLREVMSDAPVFKMQPEFIPKDGNGLNPLLQNYWMVIHPPTLFLGFATTLVPFSFCMAGLWLKKYRDWIRPALPWALFSGGILGLGILMGGYWAYETLNFGGYWNWDPVENAVYVPWLILVAAIHTMITYKNSETALKASIILVTASFILILYSTFLTRSGVLGDASVHSFTDLGLSGQLLAYLFVFLFGALSLTFFRWKHIPTSEKEAAIYSREFWIFIGVTTLCLMGFQVLLPTSIPVWNQLVRFFGGSSNMAPPADQVGFYSKFQLWFAIGIGILSAIGQFFWWQKIDKKELLKELQLPIMFALLLFAIIVVIGGVTQPSYLLLTFASVFTIVANGKILLSIVRKTPALSGGAVAHIGVGMMLLGMLFSSGYSKVVSINNTGLLYSRDAGEEFNRDNLLLFLHEPRTMAGYEIEYMNQKLELRNESGFINKYDVKLTADPDKVVALRDVGVYKENDTISVKGENTYYEIELRKDGNTHTLYPRAQINPDMGGILSSPDIHRTLLADFYTYTSSIMRPDEEKEWSKMEEMRIELNKEFFANDYVSSVTGITRVEEVPGTPLSPEDVAVKATVKVKGAKGEYTAEPYFIIHDKLVGRISEEIPQLGILFTLVNIHPESNDFTLGISTRQKDWVVIKSLEKPLINVLWIGTLVLMAGFSIAMIRRIREFRLMKEKGLE
jgi:cytochrome c-type biogenesis protein CcmF